MLITTTSRELDPQERQKIHEFLKQHPVGVLATVDQHGNPHASTVYFGTDDSLHITFTTKRDTEKHKNLEKHDTVMLAVYDAANQATVQVSGQATEVHNPDEVQAIFHDTVHAAQTTGVDVVPPIAKISAGPYVAYRIVANNIWMTEYGWGDNFAHALKHAADEETTEDPA